jgi:hypothetical protein
MAKHRYHYTGTETVHLPEQGILAEGGDSKAVYETDTAIKHPDFEPVKDTPERKERAEHTKYSMAAGVNSQISFAPETTWGTPVTPNKSLAVHAGDGIQTDTDVQFIQSIKAPLAKNSSSFADRPGDRAAG